MKNNRLFFSALALAIATPAMVQTMEVDAATSFKDIYSTNPHKAKIDTLVGLGVIAGYEDGTFRPATKVNRGQFALFISRALNLPMPTSPKSFRDVGATSSVYDGVVKAQAAGIIAGYPDGRFRAGDLITRGDMAIMLDRALQYKATFTQKATLTYTDKGSIGSSAYAPVQRLVNYKIMDALTGTSFSPNTQGDRMSTVLSIYQLMVSKDLLTKGTEEDVYPAGDLRNYSHAELEEKLGDWEVLKRVAPDGHIVKIDAIAEMQADVMKLPDGAPALLATPERFFQTYIGAFEEAANLYEGGYPISEYVTINGIPFRETAYYPEAYLNPDPMILQWVTINNIIPNPPKESGKFSIDIPAKNKDLVTYSKGKVDIEKMSVLVRKTSSNDYLVDVKALFKDTELVTVSEDGLTIKYNGITLQLQNGSDKAILDNQSISLSSTVIQENDAVLVPLKRMSEQLGLYWRQMDFAQRFEVANYPLEKGILGWEE